MRHRYDLISIPAVIFVAVLLLLGCPTEPTGPLIPVTEITNGYRSGDRVYLEWTDLEDEGFNIDEYKIYHSDSRYGTYTEVGTNSGWDDTWDQSGYSGDDYFKVSVSTYEGEEGDKSDEYYVQ